MHHDLSAQTNKSLAANWTVRSRCLFDWDMLEGCSTT